MEVVQYIDIQEEIDFFENYKKSLNDFLNAESMNIKISEYMRIVDEDKRVEDYVKNLKSKKQNEKQYSIINKTKAEL